MNLSRRSTSETILDLFMGGVLEGNENSLRVLSFQTLEVKFNGDVLLDFYGSSILFINFVEIIPGWILGNWIWVSYN